jgi:3-hydroxybutyryl-CoA dehydrogenase
MGWQIALECALHGFPVFMLDPSSTARASAAECQKAELRNRMEHRRITANLASAALERIRCTAVLEEAVAEADLVIEAVPERLDLKRELFSELDRVSPPHTILATNSSSFRISQIEPATRRGEKVLNMHFFGRVWERPMVELMRGSVTSDLTMKAASEFVEAAGFTPLVVLKESTGFLFNRIWRSVKKECLRVAADGIASFEDIDRGWMIFMDQDIGPFGMMDMIGLDVVRDIEMVYWRETGDPNDAPPPLLVDKVERGELGVKTGRGFYSYPEPTYMRPGFRRQSNTRSD